MIGIEERLRTKMKKSTATSESFFFFFFDKLPQNHTCRIKRGLFTVIEAIKVYVQIDSKKEKNNLKKTEVHNTCSSKHWILYTLFTL
jgi:hypothetical protein